MDLFIVESPAKAKTIGKYLGKNYEVIASIGHIRELLQHNDGVDVDNDFHLNYQIIAKSKPQVKKICDLAKQANRIYLASDPDREGEAIAQSLYDEIIKKKVAKPDQFYRITYTEITENAIKNALKNPRKIDQNLVDAQQSRQALDYLVGFNLSPVLWKKLPSSKSAGRVQSVALRMIVDREFEIKEFKPQEYWTINCILNTKKNEDVDARVIKYNNKTFDINFPKNEVIANEIVKTIENIKTFNVIKNETKDVKQNPYPPLTTALLQQDAVRKLGFSSKKTMTIAQHLYENGLITYMRTDGMTISSDAISNIRNIIKKDFGSTYLPEKPVIYKTKQKNAQEAHEAIRPSHVEKTPLMLKSQLENDAFRLYDLIWKRTIACQMKPAIFARKIIDLEAKDSNNTIVSRINGSQLKFNGYLSVYNIKNEAYEIGDENNDDELIPEIIVGDKLNVKNIKKEQHFTNPPSRYSEAGLIKTLESYGIGRPSTYAAIISILQDRGYVNLEKRQFHPTSRGIVVSVFLKKYFSKYVEYNYTAKLEEDLDIISDGKMNKIKFLTSFWKPFHQNIEDVMKIDIRDIFNSVSDVFCNYYFGNQENQKCPKCNSKLILKSSKTGFFFGCINYPDCKYTLSFDGISSDNKTTSSLENNIIIKHKIYGDIAIKNGPYGKYCEYNKDGKIKKTSLPDGDITQEILDFYISLPLKLGQDTEGNDIITSIGRFGPYVLCNKKFYSYKEQPYEDITLEKALNVITMVNDKTTNKKILKKKPSKNKIKK